MKFVLLLLASVYLVSGTTIQIPDSKSGIGYEDHDHDHGSENIRHLDWWEKTVFYQIYPRSFKDSDDNGEGDLNGVTSKLEHLKDLGIGATWLSPIFESPMYDSGYDISNFTNINPLFGTMEDFDNMVAKATELGIKIILDFVPNHGSTEGEWFKKSEEKDPDYIDYFVWEDAKTIVNGTPTPPNNWLSVFRGSAWEWSKTRGQYYLHQFAKEQPDLNYRNPKVVEEMKNVLKFWLDRGVAGFRVDAVNHLFEVNKDDFGGKYPDEPASGNLGTGKDEHGSLNHIYTINLYETVEMVFQWRKVLDEYTAKDNVTRVMLTEVYTDIKGTMQYYGDGTNEGSQMPFNFGLITDLHEDSSAKDLKFIIDRWLAYMPLDRSPNWVIGNHDQSRVGSRFGTQLIDAMNMLVLLLPGVGITYNGEEIGMVNTNVSYEDTQDPQACNTEDPINYWKYSRDPARTPYQWDNTKNAGFSSGDKTWLPVNENYEELNLATQKTLTNSHYLIYKSLITLRSQHLFYHGKFSSLALNDNVFAFVRWLPGYPYYVVVINLSDNVEEIDLTRFESVQGSLTLVAKNLESSKDVFAEFDISQFKLDKYESVVLMGSTASKIFTSSIFMLLLPLLSKMFF